MLFVFVTLVLNPEIERECRKTTSILKNYSIIVIKRNSAYTEPAIPNLKSNSLEINTFDRIIGIIDSLNQPRSQPSPEEHRGDTAPNPALGFGGRGC
jgi:hypothetical protein